MTYPTDLLCSQLSGSVGGLTYSHNQYGPYTKPRAIPADPSTALQNTVRGALATLTNRWATVLTAVQRKAWDRYALAVSRPGTTGRHNNIGGLPMYVRSNVPRIQADSPRIAVRDTPPDYLDLGSYAPVGPTYLDLVENSLLYHFDDSEAWVTDSWSAMLCWISPIKSAAVNFYKGPYRYAGLVTRGFGGPATSPARFVYPDSLDVDSRLHFRTRVTRNDGRLSADARSHADPATMSPPVCIDLAYYLPFPDRWIVTFDRALAEEDIRRQQWRLRWGNLTWSVGSSDWAGDTVLLTATEEGPQTGPDYVWYITADPPLDPWFTLHGAATGLAVPAFTFYP